MVLQTPTGGYRNLVGLTGPAESYTAFRSEILHNINYAKTAQCLWHGFYLSATFLPYVSDIQYLSFYHLVP